ARVGKNYGSFPGFGPNKNRRNAVLALFAAVVDAAYSEDPRSDAKAKDARLYSEKTITACCNGTDLVAYEASKLDTDAGKEGPIQAPRLIVENEYTEKIGNSTVFRWTVKGTPSLIVEPVFQLIFPRDARAISHKVSVILFCLARTGKPRVEVMLSNESSVFPSHRAFVNGEIKEEIQQGPLVKLWYLN
ncbi:MAG TPA: hypothetical protein VMZ30_08980, partial [Pyrinomonadaceae bacterium]|nr:hypothetical protein [Pyrinomonadaceae bacterium]